MHGQMQTEVRDESDATIFIVEGPIIASHSPQLRKAINDAFESKKHVIIDIDQCNYMDSSGLATLVEAVQLAENHQKKFFITGRYDDKVKHLLEITRLDELFDTHHQPTVEAAKEQF